MRWVQEGEKKGGKRRNGRLLALRSAEYHSSDGGERERNKQQGVNTQTLGLNGNTSEVG